MNPEGLQTIPVITLCGSIKFIKEFRETESALTRKGFAVLSPAFFEHTKGEPLSKEEVAQLGTIHLRKIELADEIFVIDVDGYIGESTQREIEYATLHNKKVHYYSEGL